MKQILVLFLVFQMISFSASAQQYKYHIVERGETTAEIARKYNISEETLFKYNPDARNGLSESSKLVVPIGENANVVQQETSGFKTHRVKKQETLFSLSQQYNVSIEDIKRYNKHLYSEELRRGEKVRIPVIPVSVEEKAVETAPAPASNPLDLSAKEHVVLPQETLYGISRRYNVTIADLERLNPNMEVLKPGMIIKVRNGNVEKVVKTNAELFKYYQVQPQETLFSLTRRFGVSRDSLVSLNPALADGLKSGMVLKVPNLNLDAPVAVYAEENFLNLESRINNYATKNLVVMLPFNLNNITTTDTTTNTTDRIKKDQVMQTSLDFYTGVLMAVDSAKVLGISTNLKVYDTQKQAGKVLSIISSNNFDNVDAVIGPLVQETVEAAARALENRKIPVVSPLTNRQSGSLENYLQTRPTDDMLSNAMISYISENSAGKNVVIIADAGAANKKSQLMSALPSARIVNPKEGSYVNQAEISSALVEGRPNWVILEASKIGVLSNVTSYLNSVADKYNITLMTTDKNRSYDSDNISNRHLGKLKFHYPSVDKTYAPDRNISFINNYKEKYGVVPNRFAVRGFDVTYDILLRLASAGDLYTSLNEEGATQYVENKFEYVARPAGGFQNKAIYILAYDKDMNINVVR